MRVLRWVLALPAAILCGYLAYLIGGTINNATTAWFYGAPLEGWDKTIAEAMAHAYMGAAVVYSAVRIAPAAPRGVAIGATALLVAVAAASVWSSLMIQKFYALPAIGGLLVGGFSVLQAAFAGQVLPYTPKSTTR